MLRRFWIRNRSRQSTWILAVCLLVGVTFLYHQVSLSGPKDERDAPNDAGLSDDVLALRR